MVSTSFKIPPWVSKPWLWDNKHSILPKRNSVLILSNGKELIIGQFKPSKKQPKPGSLLFIVSQEPDCQDFKHQSFSKPCQLVVFQLPHILLFITCVHGSLINSVHRLKSKNISLNLFPWMIFLHIAWQNLTADLILKLWKLLLKNKEMNTYWTDLKCSFQEVVFQAFILSWPKHQPMMFQLLLLMEIQRVFNMVKNNKRWDGPFNQQLWSLLTMSEFQLKI